MSFLRHFLTNKVARVALALCFLTGAALQVTPLNPLASEPAVAESNTPAVGPAVEGWVRDSTGQVPLQGATVVLNGTLKATTGADGYFSFSLVDLSQLALDGSPELQTVSVRVEADGYSAWSISNARYFNGVALRLHPRLPTSGEPPSVNEAATRSGVRLEEQIANGLSISGGGPTTLDLPQTWDNNSFGQVDSNAASAASAALTPPASIRVYRTATGVVEVVPFREYLKNVLPSEWIPTWDSDSLQAGAMAVKSYAWFWVARGGKQVALGADVKDNTEDQVYDPNISYSTTDAAVDATFDYAMTRYGALFQAQYCAGSYDEDPVGECPWPGPYMTQWGSAYHADQGRPWSWILQFFYSDLVITPTPPGGGYDGPPVAPQPKRPEPTSTPTVYTVGQGADDPQVFQEAYERNGGEATLGRPASAARWWLTYVSEHNVIAQPFTGADGKGNTWIVFDVLKSSSRGVSKAFLLSGAIASEYASHEPPGPEWLGAPTSDPYPADGGAVTRQGFVKGILSSAGSGTQYAAWPESYPAWKAEYFVGHQVPSPQLAPAYELPGYPAAVLDVTSPSFSWSAEQQVPYALGAGTGDWSAQFTTQLESDGGTYEFVLRADSGARLWIDNMLAINGWHWSSAQEERYSVDLAPGSHLVRVQYYNLDSSAQLGLEMQKREAPTTVAPAPPPPEPAAPAAPVTAAPPSPSGNAQLRVRVQWLGRGAPPNDSWVQPLTLHLSAPDTAVVAASFAGATDRNGVAPYSGLPAGNYNVHVKGPHSLQSARATISLSPGSTLNLDMKMQVEGDVNGDNCVTVDDFAYLQTRLGTHRGIDGFEAAADLNNDGVVSIADVSLLRSGFDRCGDISADAAFSTQSVGAAPSLSQQLAPWLRPETLTRDLKLSVWTSMDQARVGEVLDVAILAQTGTQPVDGASFIFKYDPAVLSPVDAAGNPASIMEPGLALPSVMGNWLDRNGGAVGFSAGMLQGEAPAGEIVLARLRFQVVSRPVSGSTSLTFQTGATNLMQLTNGGLNLLAEAQDASVSITP